MRTAFVLVMSVVVGVSACKKKEPKAETKVEEPEKDDYVFPKLKPGKKADGGRDHFLQREVAELR